MPPEPYMFPDNLQQGFEASGLSMMPSDDISPFYSHLSEFEDQDALLKPSRSLRSLATNDEDRNPESELSY
jgi:hypothetical protein